MCPDSNSKNENVTSEDIDSLRERIDGLDEKIVEVVNQRARLARSIGRVKAGSNDTVYKPHREHAVYEHVSSSNRGPLSDEAVKAIFREVMSGCIALEKPVRVAYLGPEGTFTHWASRSHFGDSVAYSPVTSLEEVFDEVQRERADYGVVPVENSTEGGIRETLALFLDSSLKACAEIVYEIHHSLMAACSLEQVSTVYSKGPVFGQTRRWLRDNLSGAERVEVESTSQAADIASKEEGAAAIGFEALAPAYGLEVLVRNIQDRLHNVTRFFVLGRRISEPTGEDKTAILCSVEDRVGALHDLLKAFKEHNINMTKIESFPSQAEAWDYYFFIDFMGHPEDPETRVALDAIKKHCDAFRVLGAFPCSQD